MSPFAVSLEFLIDERQLSVGELSFKRLIDSPSSTPGAKSSRTNVCSGRLFSIKEPEANPTKDVMRA